MKTLCVYFECKEVAAVVATVLSGDADEVHETDNPLCRRHMHLVFDRWLAELAIGGPTKRLAVVRSLVLF